ncbi:MAG: hypothetical protein WCK92_12205 [Bacteroidota bacterium]
MKLPVIRIRINFRLWVLFLFIAAVPAAGLNGQSKKEYIRYLKNNAVDIKDTAASWDAVADSSFFKSDIFWVGETHAIQFSYDALWILFRRIHEKTGFRYYLLESGYFSEYYLNRYFESGDEGFLKTVFIATKGTMGCNDDAYEFYRKLYRYNQGLPPGQRIEFVSIDIEHQCVETDKYIRSIFMKFERPKDTADFINQFLAGQGSYKIPYKKLAADMEAYPAKYQDMLKDKYSTVQYIVRNINYLYLAKQSANWGKTRDSLMLENFKTRLGAFDLKKAKIFAYFGTVHCYLSRSRHGEMIASLIKQNFPSLNCSSVMMLYTDCSRTMPAWLLRETGHTHFPKDKEFVNIRFDNDPRHILRGASGAGYTLFNIDRPGSVFRSSGLYVDDIDSGFHTADYFQYIVFIKDSPASIPYSK